MDYFRPYENDYVTAKEACAHYRIHPATLLRWAASGKIRYRVGLGGRNRQYEIVTPKAISNENPSKANAAI